MSFLPLLEDSINTNEAEVTIKFDQLLNYLRQIPEFSVRNGFLKNLDLLKQSIKIERNIPDLDQISSLFHCLFSIKRKSSDGIKSFFLKSKILLVWLVSVYEIFTTKSLENFKNEDWIVISNFIPKSDPFKLKYKWFTYTVQRKSSKFWSAKDDQILLSILRRLYPSLFHCSKSYLNVKISWSKVSFELSKELDLLFVKTDKQCKERYFNHLNPFLKKKFWKAQEDISLMLECLATPKQWSKIARKFPGRTQHHIKNRFICLLAKEMSCKAEKIRKMIKKNTIKTVILETIKSLDSKLQPKDSFPLDTKQNESVKSKIEENVDFSMTNSEISEKKSIPNEDNQMKNLWDNTPEEIFLESFSFFDNIDHFINFD